MLLKMSLSFFCALFTVSMRVNGAPTTGLIREYSLKENPLNEKFPSTHLDSAVIYNVAPSNVFENEEEKISTAEAASPEIDDIIGENMEMDLNENLNGPMAEDFGRNDVSSEKWANSVYQLSSRDVFRFNDLKYAKEKNEKDRLDEMSYRRRVQTTFIPAPSAAGILSFLFTGKENESNFMGKRNEDEKAFYFNNI